MDFIFFLHGRFAHYLKGVFMSSTWVLLEICMFLSGIFARFGLRAYLCMGFALVIALGDYH